MPPLLRIGLLLMLLGAVPSCRHRWPDPEDPGLRIAGAAPAPRTATALSVVTFNVQRRGTSALIRAFRADPVLRAADVVLLQEIEEHPREGVGRAAALADAVGATSVYAPRYQVGCGATHGLAIVSRLPLSDPAVLELPACSLHYNNGRVIALAASVKLGEAEVRILHTHLDTRITPAERLAQLRPVLEAATGYEHAIIAGDFNSTPFTWLLRRIPLPGAANNARIERLMQQHGFRMASGRCESTTRHLGLALDWIYVRGLEVEGAGVRSGVRASDHYPVWARVRASAGDTGRAN